MESEAAAGGPGPAHACITGCGGHASSPVAALPSGHGGGRGVIEHRPQLPLRREIVRVRLAVVERDGGAGDFVDRRHGAVAVLVCARRTAVGLEEGRRGEGPRTEMLVDMST